MSYVIQNFSKLNTKIAHTPRFRTFLILKHINIFLFFFQFNYFYKNHNKFNFFYNFFFKKGLFHVFYKLLLNLSGNYTNRLTLTGSYWNFKLINEYSYYSFFKNKIISLYDYWLYNSYFLSIKIINNKITGSFFKNIFFFIILFLSDVWYQFNGNWRFFFNFFFIKNNFKFYKFYMGYFMRVNNL